MFMFVYFGHSPRRTLLSTARDARLGRVFTRLFGFSAAAAIKASKRVIASRRFCSRERCSCAKITSTSSLVSLAPARRRRRRFTPSSSDAEAQMHSGLEFVDILAAGSARAGKKKFEFIFLDRDVRRDLDPCHHFVSAKDSFKRVNRNALVLIKILRACLSNGVSRSAICRCGGLDAGAGRLLEL
jgi:hypothetical protein